MKKSGLLIGAILSIGIAFGQDDLMDMLDEDIASEMEVTPVKYTFKAIKVINANTTETTKKNTLEFNIGHRFGNIGESGNGGVHTFFGFDQASNIRLGFDYGIRENLSVGVGRSKTNEHIDVNAKWRLISQKTKGTPLSIAYYTNAAITPKRDPDERFRKTAHRLSYVHQLIMARKFSPWLSLEVLPTAIHRNFVYAGVNPSNNSEDENMFMAIGAAGRVKFTKRFGMVVEYFHAFSDYRTNNTTTPYYNNFGIGFEIETGGHVFHLNFTNASGLIENDFLVNSSDSWDKGGYKFGFTISRPFHF